MHRIGNHFCWPFQPGNHNCVISFDAAQYWLKPALASHWILKFNCGNCIGVGVVSVGILCSMPYIESAFCIFGLVSASVRDVDKRPCWSPRRPCVDGPGYTLTTRSLNLTACAIGKHDRIIMIASDVWYLTVRFAVVRQGDAYFCFQIAVLSQKTSECRPFKMKLFAKWLT